MQINEKIGPNPNKPRVALISIIFVIVYWIISAVRSTILLESSGFISNLFGLGIWDLVLRGIVILAVAAVSIYIHKSMKQIESEKNRYATDLTDMQYVIDAADCPIIELDSQFRIKHVNKAAAILTGYKADDLLMQDAVSQLFYPHDHERVKEMLGTTVRQKMKQEPLKLRAKRIGDCYIDFQTSAELSEGKINRVFLFMQDVTDLAVQLEETRSKIDIIIDLLSNHSNPIALLNPDRILFLNHAMSSLTNLSIETATENLVSFLQPLTDNTNNINEAINKAYNEQIETEIDLVLDKHTENEKQITFYLKPVQYGQETEVLLIFRDVTAYTRILEKNVQLEAELNRAREKETELKTQYEQQSEYFQAENSQLRDKYMEEQRKNNALQVELDNTNLRLTELQEQLFDIEELKQSKAKLESNLHNLTSQLKEIQLPIIEVNPEGIITNINPAAKSMLDLDVNSSLKDRLSSKEQEANFAWFLENLTYEETHAQTQLEFVRRNDNLVINFHGINRNEDRILLYGYDVTEFHKTQQELALTVDNNRFALEDLLNQVEIERDRINAILSNVSDGIIICDMYNRITKMNPAAENLLGTRLSQAHERPIQFVVRSPHIVEHIKRTVRENLLDHEFELETATPGSDEQTKLLIKTTVIQDRFLNDQGVIIQLKKAE